MGEQPGAARALTEPSPPAAAATLFGDRLPVARRYAAVLADSGTTQGLIGPREVPRLWDRHLLNCVVVQELIEPGASVIDVGSGAGLPGLVLAIARPDCSVHLVEPMLRRTTWLESTVDELGLTNVTVHRGRAEQLWGRLTAPVVTSRAVARLGELSRWSLPLLQAGGVMLALKGGSAEEELEDDRAAILGLGAVAAEVLRVGASLLDPPTTIVRVRMGDSPAPRRRTAKGEGRRGKRGRRTAKDGDHPQPPDGGLTVDRGRPTLERPPGADGHRPQAGSPGEGGTG